MTRARRRPSNAHPPFGTLVVLLALTALSALLARLDLHGYGLAIAAAKVVLVAAVFMELSARSVTLRVVAILTVAFTALLCAGIALDIGYR